MAKQKKKKSMLPVGESKYALKVAKRAKAARVLKLLSNTPWPVIWARQANE